MCDEGQKENAHNKNIKNIKNGLFSSSDKQTKKRERFEPPKNNTSKTRRHIFSNKTHINNGRRIENEENANEKAEPTK